MHCNGEQTIFDATVSQQKMDAVKDKLYNPLKNLVFGGRMQGDGFVLIDKLTGHYASSDYQGWIYGTEQPRKKVSKSVQAERRAKLAWALLRRGRCSRRSLKERLIFESRRQR